MLHPAVLPLSMTALLALAPTCLFAQGTPIEAGQYFGVFDCGASPRAELISIIKRNDSTAVRVRTFPVNGGPYFQWHDALYQIEATEEGAFRTVQGTFVRAAVGDDKAPADIVLMAKEGGAVARLESDGLCGGELDRLDLPVGVPPDFSTGLQRTIVHVALGQSGTERINDNVDPRIFPVEILSTADEFGAFITMRVDDEGRACIFSAQPVAEMSVERRLVHGVGSCSEGIVTITERGPVLVLDWGGGYREVAGERASQDQLVAAFLSELGTPAPETGSGQGADAQSATAAGIESEGDSEGVWFGGYSKGGGSRIELNLTRIAAFGQLDINFQKWAPLEGFIQCQYVFQIDGLQAAKALLNGSYRDAAECPSDFSIALLRTGPNTLTMAFDGAAFLDEAEMNASLRPFRSVDAAVDVAGLDILGLSPGMPRDAVEAALDAAGYELDRQNIGGTRGRGWTAEALIATRRDASPEAPDFVGVQFTPVFEGENTPQRLELVTRSWEIPATDQLSEVTLRKALTDKYGPALDGRDDWFYGRDGKVLTTFAERKEACVQISLQSIPLTIAIPKWSDDRFQVDLGCGPVIQSRIRSDSRSARAEKLILVLYGPDVTWDSFWQIWSRDELQRIEALHGGVASATGTAPKL